MKAPIKDNYDHFQAIDVKWKALRRLKVEKFTHFFTHTYFLCFII